MSFFGNLLASSYKHYEKQKKVDPIFHAKLIVGIIQSSLLIFILLLLHEYMGLKVLSL